MKKRGVGGKSEKILSMTRGQYTQKGGKEERVRSNPKKLSVTKERCVNFGRKNATSRVTRFMNGFMNGPILYAENSHVSLDFCNIDQIGIS